MQFDIMGEGEVEYILMTKREHLLVYQRDNGGFVWDLQSNAFLCKIQAPE